MHWIQLTDSFANSLSLINLDYVVAIVPYNDACSLILSSGDGKINVVESYAEVMAKAIAHGMWT